MGSRPLRRLDQPRPLRVITGPNGLPHALVLDGRRRPVVDVRDDWLVQDRWWTATPVDRHYFELVIEPGRVVVTFLDARTGEWFAHVTAERPKRRPGAA